MQDLKTEINGEEVMTGGIYGFIRSFQKLQKLFGNENTQYYIARDNFASGDNFRKDIDPDYKINRTKYQDSFYKGIDYLCLILLNYSDKVFTIQCPSLEADDVPPTLISQFDLNDKILVCSNDLDFSRVMSDNVDWYANDQIFNKELFKEKYGYYPSKEKIILYKCIRGDHSDNIPKGIKNIHEKEVLYLIEKYKDVYELIENINKEVEQIGIKFVEQIKENKSRLILNHQLISFVDITYEQLKEFIMQGNYNPQILRMYYTQLGFEISKIDNRLLNEFPTNEVIENKNFFNFETLKRV
jgi:5'-3' exonuclease